MNLISENTVDQEEQKYSEIVQELKCQLLGNFEDVQATSKINSTDIKWDIKIVSD